MTTKDTLALALEALEKVHYEVINSGVNNYALLVKRIAEAHEAITAIKQAQEPRVKLIPTAEEMGTPMQAQAITPETGNAATPEASAITAGNGQAQEPVDAKRIAECLAVLRPKVKRLWPHEQALEELARYAAHPAPKALAPSREVIGRYMADKGFYLSKESLDGLMLKLEGIGGTP